MNKVFLIGRLTRDPELMETYNGNSVCRFVIAVNRQFESEQQADYFSIVAWRGLADVCGRYLKKGNKVAITGSLQSRSYEDKEGIKRSITEVIAGEVDFIETKKEEKEEKQEQPVKRERPRLEEIEDTQLPF